MRRRQENRLGQARLCLDRWRQLQPENPQAFYLEGLFFFDYLHVQSSAVDSYRRALELDPEYEEVRLGLAVALLAGKYFAEAAEHFERLRQSQPDNARVQVGLAECRDGVGETDVAVRLVDCAGRMTKHSQVRLDVHSALEQQSTTLRKALRT